MRFLTKVTFLVVLLALVAGLTVGTPVANAGGQAQMTFINNTAQPLTFFANDVNQCRIVVQYGTRTVYLTPGYYTFYAKADNGQQSTSSAGTLEADGKYTFEVNP